MRNILACYCPNTPATFFPFTRLEVLFRGFREAADIIMASIIGGTFTERGFCEVPSTPSAPAGCGGSPYASLSAWDTLMLLRSSGSNVGVLSRYFSLPRDFGMFQRSVEK